MEAGFIKLVTLLRHHERIGWNVYNDSNNIKWCRPWKNFVYHEINENESKTNTAHGVCCLDSAPFSTVFVWLYVWLYHTNADNYRLELLATLCLV